MHAGKLLGQLLRQPQGGLSQNLRYPRYTVASAQRVPLSTTRAHLAVVEVHAGKLLGQLLSQLQGGLQQRLGVLALQPAPGQLVVPHHNGCRVGPARRASLQP